MSSTQSLFKPLGPIALLSYTAAALFGRCPGRRLPSEQGLSPKTGIPFPSSERHSPVVQTKRHPIHAQIDDPDVGL